MDEKSKNQLYVGRKLFQDQLNNSYKSLFNNKSFVDVTLVSDDNVTIPAHKLVLSANSSVLASILLNNPTSHPILYLRGIKEQELCSLLDLMYKGETNVHQSAVDELLKIAKELKLNDFFNLESEIEIKAYQKNSEETITEGDLNKEIIIEGPVEQSGSDEQTIVIPTDIDMEGKETCRSNPEIHMEENFAKISTESCADQLLQIAKELKLNDFWNKNDMGIKAGQTNSEDPDAEGDLDQERKHDDPVEQSVNDKIIDSNLETSVEKTFSIPTDMAMERNKTCNADLEIKAEEKCAEINTSQESGSTFDKQAKLTINTSKPHQNDRNVLFPCNQCEVGFSRRYHLKRHVTMKHATEEEKLVFTNAQGQFNCTKCEKVLRTKGGLRVHSELHSGVKHQCNDCAYEATSLNCLKNHIKAEHEGVRYTCNQCDYKTKTVGKLRIHERVKHMGIKYPCKFCPYEAPLPEALKLHTNTQHNGTQLQYPCQLCQYITKHRTALINHKQSVHSSTVLFCDQCEFQTNTQTQLRRHQQIQHLDIKHFCDQCDYKAAQKEQVKQHKKTAHEGVRYFCDQCAYQATQICHLKLHQEAQHEGVKYICDECEFQTTQPGHLKSHKRNIHNKEDNEEPNSLLTQY